MSKLQEQFAKNLKAVRTEKRLTQADVAERTGLSVSLISMWERGTRSPPLDTLETLGRALKVDPLTLLRAA